MVGFATCQEYMPQFNNLHFNNLDQQTKCTKGWAFERVMGYELKNHEKKRLEVSTRLQCMQACLDEQEFECRSANFESTTGVCSLSDLDRGSIVPTHDIKMRTYGPSTGSTVEYIENNCIDGKFPNYIIALFNL